LDDLAVDGIQSPNPEQRLSMDRHQTDAEQIAWRSASNAPTPSNTRGIGTPGRHNTAVNDLI
jgi:hypothetical protein